MKTLKFFLGAFTIMASSVLVDAQVRSNSNSTRGGSDKATVNQAPVRSSTTTPVRTATNSNSNIKSNSTPVKTEPVRATQPTRATEPTKATQPQLSSQPTRVNQNVKVEPNRSTQAAGTVRTNENSVKPVRATQSSTGQQQNVRATEPKKEEVRTVRVENAPKAENFERRSVRYENGNNNSTGVIYLADNRREHVHKVKYNQHDYYMDNGYYYQWYNNNYRLIPAPIGFRMSSLPYGYHNMYIGNVNYYYFNGTYYNYYDNYYHVVQPPMGAIVYDLPMYSQKIFINGRKYYEHFGVVYKKVHYYGERVYQVVGYLN
jgi:hypothetical protein